MTIIIPHVERISIQHLEDTILSILENRDENVEVLVVTDGNYRDPYQLADADVNFLTLSRESSIVDCLNAGAETAQGEIACFLFPGTIWKSSPDEAVEAFRCKQVAAVVPGIADQKRNDRIFSSGVCGFPSGRIQNHRPGQPVPRHAVLAPHIAVAFFRLSALRQWGGLHPALSQQAAYIDFCFMAAQNGCQTVELAGCDFYGLPSQRAFLSLFEQAAESEKLYRLWRHRGDFRQNVREHGKLVRSEFLTNFPGLRMFRLMAGRISGRFSGDLERHHKILRFPTAEKQETDASPMQNDADRKAA